jgi:predicted phage terminase large subunit-like protein
VDLLLSDLRDAGSIYAFADPAGGKGRVKRVSARAAYVVVAQDFLTRVIVLEARAGRWSTDVLTDKLIDAALRWRPRVFGVEANAMQELYAASLSRECRQRGLKIPFSPVWQPSGIEKDFRIRTAIQPVLAAGRLVIPDAPEFYELREELKGFPIAQTKDLVDALASSIVPQRSMPAQEREEVEGLADYLRRSGAPPEYIERRIAEVRRSASALDAKRPFDPRISVRPELWARRARSRTR